MKEAKFRCIKTLKGHKDNVTFATFSPDENRIVSSSWDKTIKIWDSNSGECLQSLKGHKKGICSAAWSKDGKRCFSAAWDDTFRIWDTISGECLQIITREYFVGIYYAIWSKDKKKIITDSNFDYFKIWNADIGSCLQTFEIQGGNINNLAFCPKEERVVVGSDDETIEI